MTSLKYIILTLAMATSALAQNLLQDGGFEAGPLAPWTAGGESAAAHGAGVVTGTSFGLAAFEGSRWYVFDGGNLPSGGNVSQSFDTTIGTTYQVSFAVGRSGPRGGYMAIQGQALSADLVSLGSYTNWAPTLGIWIQGSFDFTATTRTSSVVFTDVSTSTVGVDVGLDAVSVTAIPRQKGPADLDLQWDRGSANAVLTISGSPAATYQLQSSTDTKTWVPLQSVTLTAQGTAQITFPLGTAGFYRALAQ